MSTLHKFIHSHVSPLFYRRVRFWQICTEVTRFVRNFHNTFQGILTEQSSRYHGHNYPISDRNSREHVPPGMIRTVSACFQLRGKNSPGFLLANACEWKNGKWKRLTLFSVRTFDDRLIIISLGCLETRLSCHLLNADRSIRRECAGVYSREVPTANGAPVRCHVSDAGW